MPGRVASWPLVGTVSAARIQMHRNCGRTMVSPNRYAITHNVTAATAGAFSPRWCIEERLHRERGNITYKMLHHFSVSWQLYIMAFNTWDCSGCYRWKNIQVPSQEVMSVQERVANRSKATRQQSFWVGVPRSFYKCKSTSVLGTAHTWRQRQPPHTEPPA